MDLEIHSGLDAFPVFHSGYGESAFANARDLLADDLVDGMFTRKEGEGAACGLPL